MVDQQRSALLESRREKARREANAIGGRLRLGPSELVVRRWRRWRRAATLRAEQCGRCAAALRAEQCGRCAAALRAEQCGRCAAALRAENARLERCVHDMLLQMSQLHKALIPVLRKISARGPSNSAALTFSLPPNPPPGALELLRCSGLISPHEDLQNMRGGSTTPE